MLKRLFKKKKKTPLQELANILRNNLLRTDKEKINDWKDYCTVYKKAFEHGLKHGYRASLYCTTHLSEKEEALLSAFLIRHNFILCYDSTISGFRVRKNIHSKKNKVYVPNENKENVGTLRSEEDVRFVESTLKNLLDIELEQITKELQSMKPKSEDFKALKELKEYRKNKTF